MRLGWYLLTLSVEWEAGNYDRYIEITFPAQGPSATRIYGSTTPDDDNMVLPWFGTHGAASDDAVTVTVNQTSGVDKTLDAQINGVLIPLGAGPE